MLTRWSYTRKQNEVTVNFPLHKKGDLNDLTVCSAWQVNRVFFPWSTDLHTSYATQKLYLSCKFSLEPCNFFKLILQFESGVCVWRMLATVFKSRGTLFHLAFTYSLWITQRQEGWRNDPFPLCCLVNNLEQKISADVLDFLWLLKAWALPREVYVTEISLQNCTFKRLRQ